MRQSKNPQEKKALSYQKDYVLRVEYPQLFRKAWPKKKRRAAQKDRRKVRQVLQQAIHQDEDTRSEVPLQPFRRDTVQKWPESSIPLRQAVAYKQHHRIRMTARNFFKRSYSSKLHRDRFCAFLRELTQTQGSHAQGLARLFQELLDPPEVREHATFATIRDSRVRWLQQFLDDAPDWLTPLQKWVATVLQEPREK